MEIQTTRLRLHPYTKDDLDALHRLFTDPDVRRYLLDDEVVPRAFVEHEIEENLALFETHGFGQCGLRLKDEDVLIGFCGYRFFHDPPELHLIYGIAPAYWGRGLAAEAARAMIRFGFEECSLDAVIAAADPPNKASFRVMEKCGMTFQKRIDVDGLDTIYYTIARDDYQADEAFYRIAQGSL